MSIEWVEVQQEGKLKKDGTPMQFLPLAGRDVILSYHKDQQADQADCEEYDVAFLISGDVSHMGFAVNGKYSETCESVGLVPTSLVKRWAYIEG